MFLAVKNLGFAILWDTESKKRSIAFMKELVVRLPHTLLVVAKDLLRKHLLLCVSVLTVRHFFYYGSRVVSVCSTSVGSKWKGDQRDGRGSR